MQFRIGINLGDVIVEGERLYGDGVNIAARLESLAVPGGICISGTAYDHVKNKLALTYESGRTGRQEYRQSGAGLPGRDGRSQKSTGRRIGKSKACPERFDFASG